MKKISMSATTTSSQKRKAVVCGRQKSPTLFSPKQSGGVVVLASGRGSNLRAMLSNERLTGNISAVFTNNPHAQALNIAREHGVPAQCVNPVKFQDRASFEQALGDAVEQHKPSTVALAGFMHVLGAAFVERFCGRLVNIHPSLLPQFPGLGTHRRAIESGAEMHGCSVHWVVTKVDAGPVIRRAKVRVLPGDSPETLAARVLEKEHQLYPVVIAGILAGRFKQGGVA